MRQEVAPNVELELWKRSALERIERQSALVAKLQPGTSNHKLATETLLVLKDTLHAMSEAADILEKVRRCQPREPS